VKALGQPELATDPRFDTSSVRRRNYPLVEATLTELVADWTRAELWEMMGALGLSSAPLLSVAESVDDVHLKARGAFVTIEHPKAGPVRLLAPWVRFSESPSAITAASPLMGQHTREILRDVLGLDEQQICALERDHVVASADPRDA
jgi:crotonobetainyl-CoA:carnitine CoA-transferase CaiB-like acyl-CoA transferase